VSTDNGEGQLRLLPSARPAVRYATLRPDQLSGWEHAQPSRKLIALIRELGVVEPIIVADPGSRGQRPQPFPIVEGRRRTKTVALLAEETGRNEVPALIVSGAGTDRAAVLAAVALALHASREESPASELAAIEAIIDCAAESSPAATIKQIAAQTTMSIQTIQRRLRLRNLIPVLREAFDHGKLAATVAEAAARLAPEHQAKLAQALEDGERVTLAAVRELTRAARVQVADGLPDHLFSARATPWQVTVLGHVKAASEAIPSANADGELARALAEALALAEQA
jgi:ParB-like chromosome segregation protein Spo0J